jgi:hypothetical protein
VNDNGKCTAMESAKSYCFPMLVICVYVSIQGLFQCVHLENSILPINVPHALQSMVNIVKSFTINFQIFSNFEWFIICNNYINKSINIL